MKNVENIKWILHEWQVSVLQRNIFTLFQEYAKYRSKIGVTEMYRILLRVSFADLIAKRKRKCSIVWQNQMLAL